MKWNVISMLCFLSGEGKRGRDRENVFSSGFLWFEFFLSLNYSLIFHFNCFSSEKYWHLVSNNFFFWEKYLLFIAFHILLPIESQLSSASRVNNLWIYASKQKTRFTFEYEVFYPDYWILAVKFHFLLLIWFSKLFLNKIAMLGNTLKETCPF